MTKQERAIKARAHYEDIKTRLAANTKLSIERTYVYNPDSFTQHESEISFYSNGYGQCILPIQFI